MGRCWSVLVAGVLAGCPPLQATDAGLDGGADAGSPAERHCALYAEARCSRLVACGTAEPGERTACETQAFERCDSTIGPASRAGATRLEEGVTEACLAALESAPCLFVDRAGWASCISAPGTRAPAGAAGAPCEQWQSCLEGVCAGSSRCGVCSPAAAIGERCGSCDPRVAFCGSTGVCEAYSPDGTACTRAVQCLSGFCNLSQRCGPSQRGEPCRAETECTPEDFCANLVPNQLPGSCRPRVDAGAACQYQAWDSAGGCALGTWCLDGRCASPAAGTLADGAQCSSHLQCAAGAVCEGLFGAFSYGRCATPRLGGPCLDESQFCPADGRCIVGSDGGSCRPLRGLDEPCSLEDTRWDDCRVGLACGSAGDGGARCEALRRDGRRCTREYQCLSSNCLQGLCAPPGAEGATCSQPTDCQSLSCVFTGSAVSGQCAASCF